jgi:2,4-dienoyl-CoA reductase-like NADH-dependent reductase (Old Yellow Enzyme family)
VIVEPLLAPGVIGPVATRNRIVRAGTAEALATSDGAVTDALVNLYGTLAHNEVGLVLTGHLYVHPRGQCAPNQMGIDRDELLGGLGRLVRAVHEGGGVVFAQRAHAGGQTRLPRNLALTPSGVPNLITGNAGRSATEAEIEEVVRAFAAAARRAAAAGFDGVHIHAANGYLLSEFASPLTNHRTDEWRFIPDRANRLALEVLRAVRKSIPPERAVTMKIGGFDAVSGGLDANGDLSFMRELAAEGLDAIEVSCNLMESYRDSIRPYVAVGPARAAGDLLLHRLLQRGPEEAYFRRWAARARRAANVPIIVAGGFRGTAVMNDTLTTGDADFIALARPLIREPDLAAQIVGGRTGQVDCTSCNMCLRYQGPKGVRCWRTPRWRLATFALYELGQLAHRVKKGRLRLPQAARGYSDAKDDIP